MRSCSLPRYQTIPAQVRPPARDGIGGVGTVEEGKNGEDEDEGEHVAERCARGGRSAGEHAGEMEVGTKEGKAADELRTPVTVDVVFWQARSQPRSQARGNWALHAPATAHVGI